MLPLLLGRIELLAYPRDGMLEVLAQRGGGLTLAADTRHFRLLPCRLAASATKGDNAMKRKTLTRRRFVAASAATSAIIVAAPFVRAAHAAGKLTIGLWDHWVPGANDASRALVEEWAVKEKVDVQIDYITSQGEKLRLVIAAESQAKSGHDILAQVAWYPQTYAKQLEPVGDVMAPLIKQYGKVAAGAEFLAKSNGHWVAVPAVTGTTVKPPCARLDLFKQGRFAVSVPLAENADVERPVFERA